MKKLISVCFILLLSLCVFADLNVSSDIRVNTGSAFCIPTSDYLKVEGVPVRTSFMISADVLALDMNFDGFSVFAGGSFDFVSRSLAAKRSILKSYTAFGPCIGLTCAVSDKLDFGGMVKLMFASFPHNEKFAYMNYQLFADFILSDTAGVKTSVFVPVDFSVRKDSVTVKISAGFDLALKLSTK